MGVAELLDQAVEDRAVLGITLWRAKLAAFVLAGVFAALGGVLASLFVSGAYPELVDWPITGQAIFAVMLGGIESFLGPAIGAVLLLGLNDVTTRLTEYHGLVLGVVILVCSRSACAARAARHVVFSFRRRVTP